MRRIKLKRMETSKRRSKISPESKSKKGNIRILLKDIWSFKTIRLKLCFYSSIFRGYLSHAHFICDILNKLIDIQSIIIKRWRVIKVVQFEDLLCESNSRNKWLFLIGWICSKHIFVSMVLHDIAYDLTIGGRDNVAI